MDSLAEKNVGDGSGDWAQFISCLNGREKAEFTIANKFDAWFLTFAP